MVLSGDIPIAEDTKRQISKELDPEQGRRRSKKMTRILERREENNLDKDDILRDRRKDQRIFFFPLLH